MRGRSDKNTEGAFSGSSQERNGAPCVRERTDDAGRACDSLCMTNPARTDFDDFLYAPIGADASGNPTTLLSALARLDVDPWEEAANLARLSIESATQRLASLLAALPNGPASGESVTIATRLVELLQRIPAPKVPSSGVPPRGTAATQTKGAKRAIYYLIALIFMLAWQLISAVRHTQNPADTGTAPAAPKNLPAYPAR